MKTIDIILQENWYTKEDLLNFEKVWVCNWCWWEWWFNFSKFLEKLINLRENNKILKFFILRKYDKDKLKQLLFDLSLICCIHDKSYNDWKTICDFLNANFKLGKNINKLFHWTNSFTRFLIFISVFWWTTIFWYKYFKK